MMEALRLFLASKEELFPETNEKRKGLRCQAAWEKLVEDTKEIGWLERDKDVVFLKKKWNSLRSETLVSTGFPIITVQFQMSYMPLNYFFQSRTRAKYNAATTSGKELEWKDDEELVLLISGKDPAALAARANRERQEEGYRAPEPRASTSTEAGISHAKKKCTASSTQTEESVKLERHLRARTII